ncbi:sporulation YhaL family protein [Peribacillus sp. SCS-155]|uniref:sporulation YhaL family protein n=1 Tax=Peribacillus sedimenti TaxID=3115297 RepID=UPI003906A8F3
MPLWIWFVIAGIIVSAIMTVRTAKMERRQEDEYLEQEGQKYLDRMREEQEKRKSEIHHSA